MKGHNPLFSVVTVCYNDRANLDKTSASVLGQDFDDFEWVVVDGNSTDGTKDILERFADDRLSWSSENDDGLFDAMNKGMDRAKGRYFIFMNSGDAFFDSSTLNAVARAIAGSPVQPAFIYGDSIDCSVSGKEYYRRAKSHRLHWRGQFTQHQAIFFRRTPLRYDAAYKLTADYAFIGQFLKSVDDPAEIIRLDAPVCRFLLGGINEQKRFKALGEDFVIRRRIFGMSLWSSGVLYCLHYAHALVKRFLPSVVYTVRRFSRPPASSLVGRRDSQ